MEICLLHKCVSLPLRVVEIEKVHRTYRILYETINLCIVRPRGTLKLSFDLSHESTTKTVVS